jgi:AcrR family transcriptional regulator
MNPAQLRAAIMRAAMPLMAEDDTVTTTQIAHAAGIDEAALLRVFDDKDAVLRAWMAVLQTSLAAALDPSRVLRELNSISVQQPLTARLVEAVEALDAYYVRIRTDLDGLRHSFTPPGPDNQATGAPRTRSSSRDDFHFAGDLPQTRQAIANLLQPDQEHLRLPADVLAEAFLGMSLGGARTPHPDRSPLPSEQLVDLFLHGALNTTNPV